MGHSWVVGINRKSGFERFAWDVIKSEWKPDRWIRDDEGIFFRSWCSAKVIEDFITLHAPFPGQYEICIEEKDDGNQVAI